MSYTFPENFWWGASSSAFQIEGGWDEGGKGMTVADFNSFKRSDKQADSKVASDFYHHWEEDIELMKKMGMPTIFCNSLVVADNGEITDFKMRI